MAQSESVVTLSQAETPALGTPARKIRSARSVVLGGSLVMLVSMLLVNGFNFAYNMVMARVLGPSAFGHINAAVTILLLASCISLAFQLVCAKFVARNVTAGGKAAVIHSLLGKSWIASLALAVLLFAGQKPFAAYLNLPSPWILGVLALGIAAYAPLGVKRGAMQGVCSFHRLGGNFVAEALTRFVVGVGLVIAGYGVLGAVGAISAAVIVAYFVPRLPGELRVHPEAGEPASFAEALQAIIFFIGQVVINNIDILLVKHFFPAEPAGVYAAIAQVGRLLYFVCWFGIVNAMFPVAAASREEQRKSDALGLPMLMVFGISAAFVLGAALFPRFIMGLLFGSKFGDTGSLLALYTLATGLYSLAVVVIAYEMSRRIANTGWLQLVVSGALILVIGVFHQSLREVIMVRIVLMVVMLALVCFPFLRRQTEAPLEA
ncbi:MAG TPA: oligosaccharide flippase family protein [Candidatus Angelobacter sp.]|jgi:O-antigen/teichoic acid export membrane protein|nr:oligosaccharide flippase family protein [Candidatus Angelobacter sp.]